MITVPTFAEDRWVFELPSSFLVIPAGGLVVEVVIVRSGGIHSQSRVNRANPLVDLTKLPNQRRQHVRRYVISVELLGQLAPQHHIHVPHGTVHSGAKRSRRPPTFNGPDARRIGQLRWWWLQAIPPTRSEAYLPVLAGADHPMASLLVAHLPAAYTSPRKPTLRGTDVDPGEVEPMHHRRE